MFFQRSRFMFMIAFLLVALISAGGQSIVAHAATTGGPTIALSSQTVSPGQTLTATGQGLTQGFFPAFIGRHSGKWSKRIIFYLV